MDSLSSDSSDSTFDSESDSDTSYENNHPRRRSPEGNKCLFCTEIMSSVASALNHCKTEHNFDIYEILEKFCMTRTDYTRFINFIRSKNPEPETLNEMTRPIWKTAYSPRVHVKRDLWLINDIVGLKSKCDDPTPKYVNSESGKVVMFADHFWDIKKRLQTLKEKVIVMARYIHSHDTRQTCAWHSEFLCAQDSVRNNAFETAFNSILSDKTVLVIGWSSMTLALLALDAGARSVTVLSRGNGPLVREVVEDNGLSDRLFLFEDDRNSIQQFDVLVSECMGHFLYFDNKLKSVLFARDNLLAPHGMIVPNKFTISMFGVSEANSPQNLKIAQFDIDALKKLVIAQPSHQTVNQNEIITDTVSIHTVDLTSFNENFETFETDFVLHCERQAPLTGLAGFFDASFNETHMLTTSPRAEPSHWKQTVFHLIQPESCDIGTRLNCRMTFMKNPEAKGLIIELSINGKNHSYKFPTP